MQRVLGIDLGTTNSVMAYIRRGEPHVIDNRYNQDLTPSVVARGRRDELLVGVPAKGRAIINADRTIASVKRFMGRRFRDQAVQHALERINYRVTEGQDGDVRVWLGDREYTPIEVSSLILGRLKEDAETRLGERFSRAVITVPAYFGERQVAATREAGRLAGFQVLRILNEPTAGALAYGLAREPDEEGKTILVYDLGGGTFDISILLLMQGAFNVLGIEGDNLLGGDDFDHRIMEGLLTYARREYQADLSTDRTAVQKIRDEAERIKIALSNGPADDVTLPALGPASIPLELEIQRSEFEEMIRPQIERTMELTQKAIREAHLAPDEIDEILLVGGSTAIPLVRQLLGEMFGAHKIRQNVNPMDCVALGAAIQGAMVGDIECQQCQERVSVHLDVCDQCGASMEPPTKVACPVCYLAVDADAAECWKCGQAMSTLGADGTAPTPHVAPPPPPSVQTCPTCAKPYRPGTVSCSICGQMLEQEGGLKCMLCGRVNAAGASACGFCGMDFTVTQPLDITPQNLGIELADGSFAVIIEKGTNYPTPEPVSREFYTPATGQRRLEVPVYEGDRPQAQQNEICGLVTLALPEGLPRGTLVEVAFGLDTDRTLTTSVQVMVPGGEQKRVRIRRGGLDPERQRKVEECRQRLTQYMDRWEDEITDAERRDFHAMLDELDSVLAGDTNGRTTPEDVMSHADSLTALAIEVRGTHAWIGNVLFGAGQFMPPEKQAQLRQFQYDIEQARSRADWRAGQDIYREADKAIFELGDTMLLIVDSRTRSVQGKFSPGLTSEVEMALRDVDGGVEQNDSGRVDRGLDTLFALRQRMDDEFRARNLPTVRETRLNENRS